MFSKPKTTPMKTPEVDSHSFDRIGQSTKIQGEINAGGDIKIDGTLHGNLNAVGRVVIGTTGNIVGDIVCKNADISGKIEGKVKVHELLSLKSTSKIKGEIITTKLAIEPGAVFTGTCNMSSNAPETKTPLNDKKGK